MFNKIQILTRKEIRKISEAKLVGNAAFLSLLIAPLVLIAELGYNSMKAERDKPDGWRLCFIFTHHILMDTCERGGGERKREE